MAREGLDPKSLNTDNSLKVGVQAEGRQLEFDNLFKAALVMQTEHHGIHEGYHYTICDSVLLGLAGVLELVVTTPDTDEWTHLIFDVNSLLGFTLDIFEGSSDVVDGTPVTPLNNNRNSVNTSSLTVLQDPTSITDGTQILAFGGGNNQRSGILDRNDELILKRDEIYLFRLTSLSANNRISYCADWYEHIGA